MAIEIVEKTKNQHGTTIVTLGGTNWDTIYEMACWCLMHQCGKQVSVRQFAFKKEEELTMFMLRWE
jgi:hypothetical protein